MGRDRGSEAWTNEEAGGGERTKIGKREPIGQKEGEPPERLGGGGRGRGHARGVT